MPQYTCGVQRTKYGSLILLFTMRVLGTKLMFLGLAASLYLLDHFMGSLLLCCCVCVFTCGRQSIHVVRLDCLTGPVFCVSASTSWSPGCPRTHSVAQVDLDLMESSCPSLLRLQAHATILRPPGVLERPVHILQQGTVAHKWRLSWLMLYERCGKGGGSWGGVQLISAAELRGERVRGFLVSSCLLHTLSRLCGALGGARGTSGTHSR